MQTSILPPMKIQALELTIVSLMCCISVCAHDKQLIFFCPSPLPQDAVAVSITKQLTASTQNLMWDGTDDADGLALLSEVTIPGKHVF